MPPKTGPRKVQYPKAETCVPVTGSYTTGSSAGSSDVAAAHRGVFGAPAAPVLPPPTTPEIAPVAPGYERDYAGETTGLVS